MDAELRATAFDALGRALLFEPGLSLTPLRSIVGEVDQANLAAAHHRELVLDAHPYARVFLSPDAITNGDDHLGAICLRVAREEASPEALLSWIGVLRASMAEGPWREVVGVVHDLALEVTGEVSAPELPEAPALLDDDETRLRDLARYALTPCWSGCFVSRQDLLDLQRAHHLPAGFGAREQMLTGLLRSAADFEEPVAVLRGLAALFASKRASLEALFGRSDDPVLRAFAARASKTEAIFNDAADAVARAS